MHKQRLTYLFKWIVVLTIAAGLKLFYSSAGVNDLRWVLAPTAVLVEWVTWSSFSFESYIGYMNREHTFLIAASCSGVNFLIAAFLMLSLRTLWASPEVRWSFLMRAALQAYAATIAANAFRISLAMQMQDLGPIVGWLDDDESHRLLGIVVYFGSLLVLYAFTDRPNRRDRLFPQDQPGLLRRSLWPLAVYYAVTLGIPLANGAFSYSTGFLRHSAFVLLTPILIISIAAALRRARSRPGAVGPRAAAAVTS